MFLIISLILVILLLSIILAFLPGSNGRSIELSQVAHEDIIHHHDVRMLLDQCSILCNKLMMVILNLLNTLSHSRVVPNLHDPSTLGGTCCHANLILVSILGSK